MTNNYFFFSPIVEKHNGWVAVDWKSQSPGSANSIEFASCFELSSAASLANLLPLVLQISPDWMDQNDFIKAIEPNQAILVLPPEAIDSKATLDRCKELRSKGHHLGLQIRQSEVVRRIPMASFDHVALSANFARSELLPDDASFMRDCGFRKIISDVESYEMHDWLSENGFDLCSSNFLAARNPDIGKEPDLARLKLLKLLSLVDRDGDTREIEAIFREEPKLSYNLLRLVNSVAVGARTRISNFSQAIAIHGRRQLQRWLQLLIYANKLADHNAPNPLMQLAATRGRMLELLCKSTDSTPANQQRCDNAFLTGLFSLLDVLISMPMSDILKELPLEDEVTEALNTPRQGGMLGQLLSVVTASGPEDFSQAAKTLSSFGISPETHAAAQVSALHWAARINIDND